MSEAEMKSPGKAGRPRKAGPRDAKGRLIRRERVEAKRFTQPICAEHGLPLQVEQMVAAGEARETIARAVGCTVPELEAQFADELEHGAARRRAEAIDLVWRKAREGHPGSIKDVLEMTATAGAESAFLNAADRAAGDANSAPAPRRYVGKKEIAQAEAMNAGAGTDWGDDLGAPQETLQ